MENYIVDISYIWFYKSYQVMDKTGTDSVHFRKWPPLLPQEKAAMALYLNIFPWTQHIALRQILCLYHKSHTTFIYPLYYENLKRHNNLQPNLLAYDRRQVVCVQEDRIPDLPCYQHTKVYDDNGEHYTDKCLIFDNLECRKQKST